MRTVSIHTIPGFCGKMMKTISLLMLCMTTFYASAEDTKALFQSGNTYYTNKQYDEAEHYYLQVLQRDKNSVSAAFNLGNTYYHLKKYPEAILYYEKAQKLQPDNKQIIQNLSLANNKLFSKIEFSKEFFVTQYSKNFFNSKSSSQWSYWMLACLWVSVFFFCIYLLSGSRFSRRTGIFLFLFAILFGALTYSRSIKEKTAAYGIIFGSQTLLQKTPVNDSKVIDTIQAGTKVKCLDKDSGWKEVELPTGKQGWIKDQDIALI